MRKTLKGRIWHMGIVLLIYSCIHVYSDKSEEISADSIDSLLTSTEEDFVSSNPDSIVTDSNDYTEANDGTSTTSTMTPDHSHPTWRPKRNCTPPAIEQFPPPLMSPYARKHGGLVIHIFVAIFTFLGLAIVCDDYFVSSLDRICEELKLSPDVAGATFMAAGSSAPELATVIIGVFFAKDDIGVSGVIGSAVFNIMFVISVCALCSGTVCQLNWWPLVRDCFFYSVSILVMLVIIFNDTISWMEALFMLFCYVGYCIALHFNSSLEKWAHSLKLPIKLPSKEEQSALVTYKNVPETSYTQEQAVTNLSHEPTAPVQETSLDQGYNANYEAQSSWDPNLAWGDTNTNTAAPVQSSWDTPSNQTTGWNSGSTANSWDTPAGGQKNYGYNAAPGETIEPPTDNKQNQQLQQVTTTTATTAVSNQNPDYYKSKEIKQSEMTNPLDKPTDGLLSTISWGIVYPIHYMCRLTMPDCRTEKYKNWYPFTFFISMIWISFYSYFMVWMITIIGATLGIPDTVMGLTFVAAGVSVPDALSSIAVIKEGYGDMAVSNAVGSNVFDILICLGLPWFIQTAIIKPGSHVNVISKGLVYSTLSLLSTVFFLLFATHLNGWKLDKRLGVVLMFWYFFFITIASLYELNIFGYMNPPECESIY